MLTSLRGRASTGLKKDEKINLEWKFQKGQVLRYKLIQSNRITGNWPFESYPGKVEENEVTFVVLLEVTEVNERGMATVRITFDRVTARSGLLSFECDSETDTHPPEPSLVVLKGKSITAHMSPRGEIMSLMTEAVNNVLSEEQLSAVLQPCFGFLPKRPVSQGEKWESLTPYGPTLHGDTPLIMQLDSVAFEMKNTSRIEELRRAEQEAVVSVTSDCVVTPKEYNHEFQFGSPTASAELVWLVDSGIVASMTMTTEVIVSWLLIHSKHLTTKTTFKLMRGEEEAVHPARSRKRTGEETLVSADELRRMRGLVSRVLDRLSPRTTGRDVPIAKRISNASFTKKVPRRIAACLLVITEMRNAIEYGDIEQLTGLESDAVRAVWRVIETWASNQGIDLNA